MWSKKDFQLDFDDKRTSWIERVLVYVGIACMLASTIAEIIQVVVALR